MGVRCSKVAFLQVYTEVVTSHCCVCWSSDVTVLLGHRHEDVVVVRCVINVIALNIGKYTMSLVCSDDLMSASKFPTYACNHVNGKLSVLDWHYCTFGLHSTLR